MARTTNLIQETNPDFANAAHWDNGAPIAGDSVGTKVAVTGSLANRPSTGTYSISQTQPYAFDIWRFFNSGVTINRVTLSNGGTLNQSSYNFTGSVSVGAGCTFYAQYGIGLTTSVYGTMKVGTSASFTGAVTIYNGGKAYAVDNGGHNHFNGGIALQSGSRLGGASAGVTAWTIDTTAITGTGTIDWDYGHLDVEGIITPAAWDTITHVNTASGNSLLADTAGTLTPGYMPGVDITITANVSVYCAYSGLIAFAGLKRTLGTASVGFGSPVVQVTGGTLDGLNMTFTADDYGKTHIIGVGGATMQNVDIATSKTNKVHAHNFATFTNNDTDIDHNAIPAPGSMALMGCGI